jgi:hypothetical protein
MNDENGNWDAEDFGGLDDDWNGLDFNGDGENGVNHAPIRITATQAREMVGTPDQMLAELQQRTLNLIEKAIRYAVCKGLSSTQVVVASAVPLGIDPTVHDFVQADLVSRGFTAVDTTVHGQLFLAISW